MCECDGTSPEMVLMSQPDQQRAVLHRMNLSGYSEQVCFEPMPIGALEIDVLGSYSRARGAG